jgi:hypothetical protein
LTSWLTSRSAVTRTQGTASVFSNIRWIPENALRGCYVSCIQVQHGQLCRHKNHTHNKTSQLELK